jgi:hypothetical protein
MKKIGDYTTRGTLTSDGSTMNRIILDDGSFKTGYRVVEFKIGPHDMDSTSARQFTAKLLTDDTSGTGINWNWDNNEEIAWAIFCYDANNFASREEWSLVDPDNLIIQDLYILVDDAIGSSVKCNYYMRLEKYDITDSQGALAMVRNRSQA